jgi:hypothetical protein
MVLTLLGLTLAATTSAELGIAVNHRTAIQAETVARSGIEAGKSLLRTMDWSQILPPARTTPWAGAGAPPFAAPGVPLLGRRDAWGNNKRDLELGDCDVIDQGAGYGVVLDDGSSQAPYQFKTTLMGKPMNGAITLWVRRVLRVNADGSFSDSPSDDELVLTAEGVVPFVQGSSSANRTGALAVTEATLRRTPSLVPLDCTTRAGQAGTGAGGAGFGGCEALTSDGVSATLSHPSSGSMQENQNVR